VKKLIALALVAAFLATAGIGCSSPTSKAGGTPPVTSEKK